MKVVDLVSRNPEKLSLNFLDCSTNLYQFYKFAGKTRKHKKLDLQGVRPPPWHCLRGRMIFSQQAKKTPESLPHPYTGARRLVS